MDPSQDTFTWKIYAWVCPRCNGNAGPFLTEEESNQAKVHHIRWHRALETAESGYEH